MASPDPISMGTLLTLAAIKGSADAASSMYSTREQRKLKEKELEEIRKKRKSDFLSASLDRDYAAGRDLRANQADLTQQQINALQSAAQNIRLGGRR